MCAQVPVRITRLFKDRKALVQNNYGEEKVISLEILACATLGDYVIVVSGYALQKLNPQEAKNAIVAADKMMAIFSSMPSASMPQMAFAF